MLGGKSLSRARRAASRSSDVSGVDVGARAFYRTDFRIELPQPVFLAGLVGVGFALFAFPRRVRLRPLSGLGFGHVCFTFLNQPPVAPKKTVRKDTSKIAFKSVAIVSKWHRHWN
jgi:hypothetical protein